MVTVVYIAAPMSLTSAWKRRQDQHFAEEYCLQILKRKIGAIYCPAAVLQPFVGELRSGNGPLFEGALEILRRCDVVFVVPGWLKDARSKAEKFQADALKIPVFDDLVKLQDWQEARERPAPPPPPAKLRVRRMPSRKSG